MIALGLVVTVETIGRKFFGFSLQGADELGGYVLAVGSSIGFSVALIERAHIRVDLIHRYLPGAIRGILNWLAILLLALLALLLTWVCASVLIDTVTYRSVAPSPWATPLIYPQSIWYGCLLLFSLLAVIFAIQATWLMLRGRLADLDTGFGPREVEEEVKSELEDLQSTRSSQHAAE